MATLSEEVSSVRRALFPAFLSAIAQGPSSKSSGRGVESVDDFVGDSLVAGTPQPALAQCGAAVVGGHGLMRAQRKKRPRRLLGAGVASKNAPAPPSHQSQITSVLVTATTETAASTATGGAAPRRSSPAARRRQVQASTFERVFEGKPGDIGAEPPQGGGLGAFLLIEPSTKSKRTERNKTATYRPRCSRGMDPTQTCVDGRTAPPKHRGKRDRTVVKKKSAASPNNAKDALVTLFQRRHSNSFTAVGDTLGQLNSSSETLPRSMINADPTAVSHREGLVGGLGAHRNTASKKRRSKTDKRRREPDSSPRTKEQPMPVPDALGHLGCPAAVGTSQENLRAERATNGTNPQRMSNCVGSPRRNTMKALQSRKKASAGSNACIEASQQKALLLAKLIKGSADVDGHRGNARTSPTVTKEREADSSISSDGRKRPRCVGGVTPVGCRSEFRRASHSSKPIQHNNVEIETNDEDAKPCDVVVPSTLSGHAASELASPPQSDGNISNKILDTALTRLRRTARKRKPVARFTVGCFSEDRKKRIECVSAPLVTIGKESADEYELEDSSNSVSKFSKVSPSVEGVPHAHSIDVSDSNVNEKYLESPILQPLSQKSRNIECLESDAGYGRHKALTQTRETFSVVHEAKVAAKDNVGQPKNPRKRQRSKAVDNNCFTGAENRIRVDDEPSDMANEKRCSVSAIFVQGSQTALRRSTRKSTPTDRLRVGWDSKTYAGCRVEKSNSYGLSTLHALSPNASAQEDNMDKRMSTSVSLLVAAKSDKVTNSTDSDRKTRQDSPKESLCSLACGHGADEAKRDADLDDLITMSKSAVSRGPMNRILQTDQAEALCKISQQFQPTDQSTAEKITTCSSDDTSTTGKREAESTGAAGQTSGGGSLQNHRLPKATSFTGNHELDVAANTMNHANSTQRACFNFAQSLVMDLECLLPQESGSATEFVRPSSEPNACTGSFLEARASEFDNTVGFEKTNESSRSLLGPQRLEMHTTYVSSVNSLIQNLECAPSPEDNVQTGLEYCESYNGRRSSRRTKPVERLNVSWTKRDYDVQHVDAKQKKVSGGGSSSKCTLQRSDPHKGEATKKAHAPAEVRRSSRTFRPINRFSITWKDIESSKKRGLDKPKTAKEKDEREPAIICVSSGDDDGIHKKLKDVVQSKDVGEPTVKDVSSQDNDGIHKKLKDSISQDACDTKKVLEPGKKQSPTDAQLRKKVSNMKTRLQAIAKEKDNHHLKAASPSGTWTNLQVSLLKSAMGIVNPTSSTFWDDVAAQVAGKTAVECRDKWFVQVKTPKARQRKIRQEKAGPAKKAETEESAINSSTQHVWEEDDIFHSTPMRSTMRVGTETTHGARLAGAGFFVHLPCDFNSPITDSPAPRRKESPMFDGFSPSAMSPALIRHGYKGYIKSLAKSRHMSRVAERRGKLAEKGKSFDATLLSAHVGAGDVEMKACLSPGGTMRLECPSDNDLDGMIIPPGDEFSDSEKDVCDDLLSP